MRFVTVLTLLLLPTLAQAQGADCLITGQTARISGKVAYLEDSATFLWTRTAYVIKLLQTRCYIRFDGSKSERTIEVVQVYAYSLGAPERIGSLPKSPDDAKQRQQAYKFLKTMIGKYVVVTGNVEDTSLSGYPFTNPIMSIRSITACELLPKSKQTEKC
jgi:hypothetical protein